MVLARPIHSIPPGAAFLETLVDALIDGRLIEGFEPRKDPLALASATLYLPTRRALRAAGEIFLGRLGSDAAILPQLLPLGEVDEDESAFEASADALAVPDAISPLARQIGLSRLILAWSSATRGALLPHPDGEEPLLIPSSPGDAAGLARDLARFIDGMQIDRVPLESLNGLTAEHEGRYDRYWDLTLKFLAIATAQWPLHLVEVGRLDPVERQNRLLEAEAARIRQGRITGPVIVAGSTGSVPATRDLMAAIIAHPLGAIVLPGLDLTLDPIGWAAIGEGESAQGHPQATLKSLIDALGVARDEVRPLGTPPPTKAYRARLVSEALRPAATTDLWRRPERLDPNAAREAFRAVSVVEAAHEGEEALAIALALREALEMPGRTAALVTPDRGLAARVVAELGRWAIAADDSAGRPLAATPPGIFARLVLDAALGDFEPVAVLALLKHPFATLGLPRAEVRRAVEVLEIGALRGPQPPPGLAGLTRALTLGRNGAGARFAPAARRRLSDHDWATAADLLVRLGEAIGPFAARLGGPEPCGASIFFDAHRKAVEAVAAGQDQLHALDAGRAFEAFQDDLLTVPEDALHLPPAEYPGLFAALIADRVVRGGEPKHGRIAIYGVLEARLLTVDRLVLGGLDEGIWPGDPPIDPWLNRPMRAALGLSAPEKRIGLAAHDFEQGLGADEVIVTRALKRARAPTVPSRWLQRLEACLGAVHQEARERGAAWVRLARTIDAPVGVVPIPKAPRPRPPRALRPSSLSVTRIEDLVRDPYSIYARSILKLEPLDAIAASPGAADRGTLVHEAIRRFAALCEAGIPDDAETALIAIGDELFEDFADYPDVATFWRPRFRRIASFLSLWEKERRPLLGQVMTEISGSIAWLTISGRTFTLTAQADRIELGLDGLATVIDFKTGEAPTVKQVQSGIAPQLALETAMLAQSGFPEVAARGVAPPIAVRLGSGRDGRREVVMAFDGMSAAEAAGHALARLKELIDRFEKEETAYVSLLHPMFKGRRYGDYDHLARVREWSLASEENAEP